MYEEGTADNLLSMVEVVWFLTSMTGEEFQFISNPHSTHGQCSKTHQENNQGAKWNAVSMYRYACIKHAMTCLKKVNANLQTKKCVMA